MTLYFADFVCLNDSGLKKLLPEHTTPAKTVKYVVCNLDNTVWDGVLIESNPDALQLRPNVLDTMKLLD